MDVWRPVDGETLFRSARLDCALSRFPGALKRAAGMKRARELL